MFILLSFSPLGLAQQSTTVWAPGINYSLTYAQDIQVNFANVTLNQANLPTAFNVTDMNNTGYKYVLQGNSDEKSVNMEILNVPNLGTFELPTGDLPIFLPISFNGKEDWMDSFGAQLQVLGGLLNNLNESAFYATNITITNNDISFSLVSNLPEFALSNTSEEISSYFQFLPEFLIEQNATFNDVTLSTNVSYSKTSGILETLSIELSAANATVNNQTYFNQEVSQKLIFAAVLPPFGSSGFIDSPIALIGGLIAIPVLVRSRKTDR